MGLFGLRRKCPVGQAILYPIEELKEFPGRPVSSYDGVRLGEMIKSIKSYGIITPILVRDTGNDYEVLAGYNRLTAARVSKFKYVPVYNLGELSDDEALYVTLQSNIVQKGFMEMPISERAKAVATRLESLKGLSRSKYFDHVIEIVGLIEPDGRKELFPIDKEELPDGLSLSPRSMRRYNRINLLPDEFKSLLDDGRFSMGAAVNLSYLNLEELSIVRKAINSTGVRIRLDQSINLRLLVIDDRFTELNVYRILRERIEDRSVLATYKVQSSLMKKYFVGYNKEEATEIIEEALAMWFGE